MSEVVARGYDEIADRFAVWAADIPDSRPSWARLEAHLPEGARVLELGCGAGLGDTASREHTALFGEARLDVLRDEVVAEREPDGDVMFQWVLARA